jgi:hypothetical protein
MQEGGGGDSMHLLLSILADGEEQARRLLRELPPAADDQLPLPANECCRGVARQIQCTFRKAIAVAKAIEPAGGAASGTDSPRSADESSGAAGMATRDAVQAQERQGICKRRCVCVYNNLHAARSLSALFLLAEVPSYLP